MSETTTRSIDSELETFAQKVLDHRKTVQHGIHNNDLERLAAHLRNTVLPQLQELQDLKATMAKAKKAEARA